MQAVIPAAGQGTRMRPLTHTIPKEMVPVGGAKPAIQHVVEEAIQAGITEIVVVIAPGKTEIVEHLTHVEIAPGAEFQFVIQRKPRGLGDAILQAKPALDEDALAVLYPDNLVVTDEPAIGQLVDLHRELGAPVTHVVEKPDDEIGAYSAIDATEEREGLYRVHDMVEKPDSGQAPSNLAPIGRHVLDRAVLNELETTEPGHGDEIQLTDAMAACARQRAHYAMRLEGQRLDVGNPAGFAKARALLQERTCSSR